MRACGPPARFSKPEPQPKPQQRLPDTLGGGGCGWAGHAVNPSMGARWRLARVRCPAHTARPGLGVLPNPPEACLGPMAPTVLPSRTLRLWTHFCERGAYMRGASPLVAANLGWQQLLTLLFSFDFEFPLSFRARRKLSEGGRVTQAGPLAPWMAPSSLQGRTCGVSCLRHPSPSSRDQCRRREQRCKPTSHTAPRSRHPCPAPVRSSPATPPAARCCPAPGPRRLECPAP